MAKDSYLKLAFDNFAHFAPPDPALTAAKGKDRDDHQRAWETYHERALDLVSPSAPTRHCTSRGECWS